jgi:hypothetical protein
MAIAVTKREITFGELQRGAPFASTLTLYTRSNFEEDPKEHIFYKVTKNKAVTVDKRTFVHFQNNDKIKVCNMNGNPVVKKAA